jgi:transposase-like protein
VKRNRDTADAETARATTWPLRAASMGLRLADVTEMPTLRERRPMPGSKSAAGQRWECAECGKHFFVATTR